MRMPRLVIPRLPFPAFRLRSPSRRHRRHRRHAVPARPLPPVSPIVPRKPGASVLRERAERRRRRLRAVSLAFAALVLLAAAALVARDYAGWRSGGDAFRVRTLAVSGTKRVTAGEIPALKPIGPGTSMFDFDAAGLSEAISRHPWILRAEVTRTLPDRVDVVITEREPVAIVMSGEDVVQIDAEGVLLPTRDDGVAEDLPVITGAGIPHPIPFGAKDGDASWARAASFLAGLESIRDRAGQPALGISELHVNETAGEFLVMEEGGRCLRFPADEPGANLPELFTVLGELASADLVADYVDLRFHGQVVVGGARPREVDAVQDSIAAARAAAPEGERAG